MDNLRILLISGFDPTGESGIILDSSLAAVYGLQSSGIPTCLVEENSKAVRKVNLLKAGNFQGLLESVLDEGKVNITKIGLIPHRTLPEITGLLIKHRKLLGKIVMDPVLGSTTGFMFHKTVSKELLELISICNVITPNYGEALRILESYKKSPPKEPIKLGKAIRKLGPKYVVITGVESHKNKIRDYLFLKEGSLYIENDKISRTVRGTGCAFSTLLAIFMAKGLGVNDSFKKASIEVNQLVKNSKKLNDDTFVIIPGRRDR